MDNERLEEIKNRVTEDIDHNDGEWLIKRVERLEEYISQLEQEHNSMAKALYKILRIANTELND